MSPPDLASRYCLRVWPAKFGTGLVFLETCLCQTLARKFRATTKQILWRTWSSSILRHSCLHHRSADDPSVVCWHRLTTPRWCADIKVVSPLTHVWFIFYDVCLICVRLRCCVYTAVGGHRLLVTEATLTSDITIFYPMDSLLSSFINMVNLLNVKM